MIEPFLHSQLEPVARRQRQARLQAHLALCWGLAALVGFLLAGLAHLSGLRLPWLLPVAGLGAALASLMVWKRGQSWQPDFRQIARQIEQHHPDLHALLLTAVEQQPDPESGKFSYLQERVIQDAVSQNQQHQWIETVSRSRLMRLQWAQFIALAALVAALVALRSPAPLTPAQAALPENQSQKITVTPGDAAVEKGSALVVLARFAGPLPTGAELVVTEAPGDSHTISLVKNLDDPVFGGSIAEVTNGFSYHIEYGGKQTRDFKVTVFEHPRLERADAKVHFPQYTGLAEKEIKDTRRISAVEGSKLDLALQLNKPVARASLVGKDQSVVPLVVDTSNPVVSLKDFPLEASRSYSLQLVDTEGRTNKVPAQFVLEALKNRAPELKIASPRGDQKVSPLEELAFQAETWDDFGVRAYGLAYTVAGQETKFIELGQTTAPNEKRSFNYLLKLEDLGAHADQLISYFIWADDVGPDGALRRTSSDMYFAEVRPFDEIFREGQSQDGQSAEQQQQQSGQQSGGGNQAQKLAELQKQIINATWKLQRQNPNRAAPVPAATKP